ncbi:MAG: exonuclease domain-containing protein [Pseudomonadota bacterium]
MPEPNARAIDSDFLCVDLETNGLDPTTASLLSVGSVAIERGRVVLASATHRIVRANADVGISATVHGLTDTVCAAGESLDDVLGDLLAQLEHRVLVVHYAGLDVALLDRLCRARFGAALNAPVVDTLELGRRALAGRQAGRGELRLGAMRERYGLPAYRQHNSLTDALATAELLLAIIAHRDSALRTRLSELLC